MYAILRLAVKGEGAGCRDDEPALAGLTRESPRPNVPPRLDESIAPQYAADTVKLRT